MRVNVVVPGEWKLTVVTCKRAGAIIQTTCDGVNGGTLPSVWLAHVTSHDSVTKQPHLSPQHYELNDRQHVRHLTRVSVSKRCPKVMKKQVAWEKPLRRLFHTTQEWPFVKLCRNTCPSSSPKGGRGGGNLQEVIAMLLRCTQNGLWAVVWALIWRRSSACKPVEKAVLPNGLP